MLIMKKIPLFLSNLFKHDCPFACKSNRFQIYFKCKKSKEFETFCLKPLGFSLEKLIFFTFFYLLIKFNNLKLNSKNVIKLATILIFNIFLHYYTESFQLTIRNLEVPNSVPRGSPVLMSCDFEETNLYSIKWYKNYVEFFR